MELSTFYYKPDTGWSVPAFPSLDSEQSLVLVFAAPEYMERAAPLAELRRAYPRSRVVGCSTAGEIAGTCVNDASLSVAVVRFAHTRLAIASTTVSKTDSFPSGAQLAREFDPAGLRALLVLSDGLDVNGSELVRGISAVLPREVIVVGGLAGDGNRFERTWVLCDDKPQQGAVVGVGLYGDRLCVGQGSRGGWDVFGPERRITRSQANVLYELDGEPALALYKEYLGKHASGLPASAFFFPLAIRPCPTDADQLVRSITAIDEVKGSLIFAGDVPTGWYAQLMHANLDRLVAGAREAAARARTDGTGPQLAVAVSCAGRRVVLGERTEHETETTLEAMSPTTQQVGFYSYGEISSYGDDGFCDLHNETMTIITLSER